MTSSVQNSAQYLLGFFGVFLQVDAHADINTDETSPSGNLHGMPVAVLMRGLEGSFADLPGLEWADRK